MPPKSIRGTEEPYSVGIDSCVWETLEKFGFCLTAAMTYAYNN